jgi:hypothetical protein
MPISNNNQKKVKATSPKGVKEADTAEDLNIPAEYAPVAEPPSFIVQNITPGPHFVNDLELEFKAFEVVDLTWEDPVVVRRSRNLVASLNDGYLRKITKAEWEEIERENRQRAEREALDDQRRMRETTLQADGRYMDAEEINLSSGRSRRGAAVSTSGYANDPMSYARAFKAAEEQARSQGRRLSAFEFAQSVKQQGNKLSNTYASGAQAYVAQPGDYGTTNPVGHTLSNVNRDNRLAGSSAYNIDLVPYDDVGDLDVDLSMGEAIDLDMD